MSRFAPGPMLLAQRGQLFLWLPVVLALGIAGQFSLLWEPGAAVYGLFGGLCLAALGVSRLAGPAWGPVWIGAALIAIGFLLAGLRIHAVSAPVLGFRYYGPVEGRVVALDRSYSNALRVTLDRVVLTDTDPRRVPERVRIALHGDQLAEPHPGDRMVVTAHLAPPAGPVEPGGYDFRRHAWFLRLGAVGYTRSPMLRLAPAEPGGLSLRLFQVRMQISAALQTALPGREGAFAAAILVGDRSGLDKPALEALRASNLAHLLAISGLHMGLLTGTVFAAIRLALALVPALALRLPGKKVAALGALAAGLAYLLLSGSAVATERAFVMVAVVLGAVLLDFRAITLRAVALAAVIVLVLRPEALTSPGFQMSFAATTALVAVFGALRDWGQARAAAGRRAAIPVWARGAVAVALSSAIAGAATAPVSAAHFNQIAAFGLIANLASVPVMGLVVMPALLLACLVWPLGLSAPALSVAGWGIAWILGVAEQVAGWEGAVVPIVQPPHATLPLIAIGALFWLIWRGRARWAGVPVALAGFLLWSGADRPDLLVSADGRISGVMTAQGRWLDRERGAGFVAENWLENDGDAATQADAAQRSAPPVLTLERIEGGAAAQAVRDACRVADVVIAEAPLPDPGDCLVVDAAMRAREGAVAVSRVGSRLQMTGAAERTGARVWAATGGS